MKIKVWASFAAAAAVAAALVVISTPISAHHGTADYDMTKLTTLKGTVTDFQFMNPHTEISLDVKDDKGNVEKWVAEGSSATGMSRIGWTKNTVKPGDEITVVGNRPKNGAKALHLRKIVLSNGKEFHVERVEDEAEY